MAATEHSTLQWAAHTEFQGTQTFATLLGASQWPLLAACLGTYDRVFSDDLAEAHNPTSFGFMTDDMKTLFLRHKNFKMLSRAGAYMREHISRPHELPKFQVFRLVHDPTYAQKFLRFCKPMRDDYSDSFVSYYHDAEGASGLCSLAALFELTLMIMFGKTSTVRVESLNAWFRRQCSVRCQQKVLSFVTLSVMFIKSQFRSREHLTRRRGGAQHRRERKVRKDNKLKTKSSREPPKKRMKRGGGGTWRAFTSSRCRAIGRACFKALAAAYKVLSAEERAPFEEMGRLGTLSHRRGSAAFGLNPRALVRAMSNEAIATRVRELCNIQVDG